MDCRPSDVVVTSGYVASLVSFGLLVFTVLLSTWRVRQWRRHVARMRALYDTQADAMQAEYEQLLGLMAADFRAALARAYGRES